MAPMEKKPNYVAPGKLGLSQGQGKKPSFLPGFLAKAPSSSTSGEILSSSVTKVPSVSSVSTMEKVQQVVSNLNHTQVPSVSTVNKVQQVVSNLNQTQALKVDAVKKRKQVLSSLNVNKSNPRTTNEARRENTSEEVHEEDQMRESINNAALRKMLEQGASQATRRIYEEATFQVAGRIIEEGTSHAAVRIHEEGASQDSASMREEVSTPITRKRTRRSDAKPRGVNKCTKVANLKDGKKLGVEFFYNGPVGDNQKDMTRHMGKLVRDRTICPVRVHSWDEIDESAKEHMWQSVLNKFNGNGIELERRTILDHMKRLWHNWRGILNRYSIIKKGGPENALKETPNDLTPEDWEWLVKEHFCSDDFKKVSARNSENRGNLKMPHHTGSMPFRQVIWEDMGGKEGNDLPPISAVFKKTRQRKSGNLDELENEKYEEIINVEKHYPSLSQFEVVEVCFGEQDRGSVVCFGSGVKPKFVRGPLPTRADLTTRLQEKQRENEDLRKRMDEMEVTRQKEREAYDKKINEIDKKFEMLVTAFMQQSKGRERLNNSVN